MKPPKSPLELNSNRALVRLHGGAEFGVVVDIDAGGVGDAERGGSAGVGAVLASPMPWKVMLWLPRLTVMSEKFCTRLSTNFP